MQKRYSIEFVEEKKPIIGPVTKFGGQPTWVTEPQWPISQATGKPMCFICQIAIAPELFGQVLAKMAYIFMTVEDEEDECVDGTWKPDGGENAVILQPGTTVVTVKPLANGPTIYKMVKKMFKKLLVPKPCEFSVKLTANEDPDFVHDDHRTHWDEEKLKEYAETLDGNKIGGTPIFLQNAEFPGPGLWKLLLQLDSTNIPFYINFGDAGMGYAFLSEDGKVAKFLWQCL